MESTKKCTKCGNALPLSMFYLKKNGHYSSWCKECTRDAAKESLKKKCDVKDTPSEEQYAKNMAKVAEIKEKQEEEKKKLPVQIVRIPEGAKYHTKETAMRIEHPETEEDAKEFKPLDIPPMPEDFGERKATSRRTTLNNAEPVDLMIELANRGYFGFIHYIEHKKETIEHNGHNGIFEYDDEHIIDITKLK